MTDNFEQAEAGDKLPGPHDADPNEDPERHLGPVIPDPWLDPAQTDWETHTVHLDPRTMDV